MCRNTKHKIAVRSEESKAISEGKQELKQTEYSILDILLQLKDMKHLEEHKAAINAILHLLSQKDPEIADIISADRESKKQPEDMEDEEEQRRRKLKLQKEVCTVDNQLRTHCIQHRDKHNYLQSLQHNRKLLNRTLLKTNSWKMQIKLKKKYLSAVTAKKLQSILRYLTLIRMNHMFWCIELEQSSGTDILCTIFQTAACSLQIIQRRFYST